MTIEKDILNHKSRLCQLINRLDTSHQARLSTRGRAAVNALWAHHRAADGAAGMQLMKTVMMISTVSVKIMIPEMMKDEEKKTVKKFLMKNSEKENEKKKFKEFL
ncbi:hypothetical protein ACJ72_08737 [Emergomyces africanus]|uniref:Uncharacterized protein n=1 Tax=Emergomyces africanus TaxID=1955775 RepID=A0A1B7NJC2_9EURO|nr:hypothetical protein ACJ72_08737 [Emergomyces africanus]